MRHVSRRGARAFGPWTTSLDAGSVRAGLYERAAIAVHALFVLDASQTLYFRAHTDDEGRPLDARCDYAVSGVPLPARWWSITAYGEDDYLIPNPAHRYSWNMRNLPLDERGRFLVRAARTPGVGSHLPTGAPGEAGGRRFSLVLRLYNPTPTAASDLPGIVLPRIERAAGSCP